MPLAIRNLSHRYGNQVALNNLSFTLDASTVTALLGPNGAGKSTLIKILAGLLSCQQGEFEIEGETKRRIEPRDLASFGFVFQEPALDGMRSGLANLEYAAGLHGLNPSTRRERIKWVSQLLNLEHLLARKPMTLSGGERRRIEIGRALLHRPNWLLLDEPSVGLDIDSRLQLSSDIHELAQQEGIGVLWCTHITDELREEDQLLIVSRGEVKHRGQCGDQTTLLETYKGIANHHD